MSTHKPIAPGLLPSIPRPHMGSPCRQVLVLPVSCSVPQKRGSVRKKHLWATGHSGLMN